MFRNSQHIWATVCKNSSQFVFVLAFSFLSPLNTIQAGSLDLKSKAITIATEIATNPAGFFYDIHQMGESVVPARVGKRGAITSQIFTTLLPFTMANINGRFNLWAEHPGIPQIEIFGGYSQMLALNFVDTESTEGEIAGSHYGVSLVQSIHPRARVQLAYEVSSLVGEVKFKKKPIEVYGTSLSNIKLTLEESFILTGVEVARGNRKYLFTQMGFGLDSSRILARVIFSGPRWETGFTVYPEGPLVIYPTVGLRFGI